MSSPRTPSPSSRRPRGFTLIEVMVVSALVGVLAALAGTSYEYATAKAKRTEAYALLSGVLTAQEYFLGNHGRYAGTFDELGFEASGGSRLSATEIAGRYYTLQLSQPDGPKSFYCSAVGNIDGDAWLDVVITRAVD